MPDSARTKMDGLAIGGFLECISAPAIVLDTDYRILGANRRYCREFSSPGSVVGRRCFEVAHGRSSPCEQNGERCPLRTSWRTGQPARTLHVHRAADGEAHKEITVYPVPRDDGRPPAFLEIVRDCTVASASPDAERLVGGSTAFNKMLALVQRVAATDVPVLLLGESGTGKELVASAVHMQSTHGGGPLVPVDCSGLNESLFESELFGHERGAFTGAYSRKLGLVEAASGGTLFLDEIGDIPLSLQVKLLRLVETGMFRRVGGVDPIRANFRLVCATHRDLPTMVGAGEFRGDLFFRIGAFPVRVPPLRERHGDIPLLARSLLRRIDSTRPWTLAPETLEILERYPFPGNVRELLHILERACVLAEGDVILPEHLPGECRADALPEGATAFRELMPLRDLEEHYLAWAVGHFEGDNVRLAERLGVAERTLYRKLRRMRLRGRDSEQVH